ncbi:MAG TPA: hypothetical protein PKM25_08275, partial [Candidatus Ozemobacteraceae bacterium]|nr:hypothetical protein [Candidatus Ozemobacteraceae bacterium]
MNARCPVRSARTARLCCIAGLSAVFLASEAWAAGTGTAMATAVHMWTFTAELVSACTRQGKMPGIWPSGTIPHYEVWEKKYEAIRFHDDFTIAPIGAGAM